MAGAKEIIDTIIRNWDGVDPDDADNAFRRTRLLQFLQSIYEYVWNFREWEWTCKEDTVTITAGNNSVNLPTGFLELGHGGSVFQGSERWAEASRYEFSRIRNQLTSNPHVFCIYNGKLNIPRSVSVNTAFTMAFRFQADTLADSTNPFTMPPRYTNLVLIPGLAQQAEISKQDERDVWAKQFQAGLAQMCSLENPGRTEVRRLPHAVRAW